MLQAKLKHLLLCFTRYSHLLESQFRSTTLQSRKVLQRISATCAAFELELTLGMSINFRSFSSLLIEIHINSGLMFSACARHSRTKNPELATLFSQCSQLLQLPVMLVFAFDGSGRPKMKRGKTVRGNSHWLTHDFKEMLRGFGFPYIEVCFCCLCLLHGSKYTHQAPG